MFAFRTQTFDEFPPFYDTENSRNAREMWQKVLMNYLSREFTEGLQIWFRDTSVIQYLIVWFVTRGIAKSYKSNDDEYTILNTFSLVLNFESSSFRKFVKKFRQLIIRTINK